VASRIHKGAKRPLRRGKSQWGGESQRGRERPRKEASLNHNDILVRVISVSTTATMRASDRVIDEVFEKADIGLNYREIRIR